ncbi:aromatic acid exporter family protein [Clostridium sp. CX1]|uniref:Aromatic acid exporter family protein n=1 Tax=Clostridium tanneri TaxID=3037988 RepID=A0ABU4JX39_9CLOT|nr:MULTISPECIES: aromatic acid exporter family protein [unclassified Clostridium]MCT8975139.1 aromatic acid exporter family protein [Clostridium sp. CX1]MDW8802714.1 aromatic acid exporter family protein [Clostridium sp. A1-XYC3]
MKFIGYRTLKTGIGAAVAMIIAKELGLEYSVSAGIITILSIQSTKKQSVIIAVQRIGAFILALFLSIIIFKLLGYNPLAFGVFLLIFIPLTVRFNLDQGIVVSSVLITHLLVQKSTELFWIWNELSLMLIGVGVALLLNLYMPSIEGKIKEDQNYIEEKMKEILIHMADTLKNNDFSIKEDELVTSLEKRLHKGRNRAYNNFNNFFLLDTSYYVQYMEMRIQQFETIKRMREHFQRFFMTYEQTIMIADFTENVANSIYEENTAEGLLNQLNFLRDEFRKMALPSTREEFENRAMLFQFLNDLEQFLLIKHNFKKDVMNGNE